MARPTKAVVDYFPLVCEFSDSIKYIENIYGNDGVAFWIKLLQKLGRTENHFIDCRNNTKWKILYGEMKIDEVICENILNDLAELECIDKIFWDKKVIYSENFVLGIKDAYKKRTVELLSKGQLLEQLFNFCGVSGVGNSVSGDGNPQSKVKEIKEKESKVNNILFIPPQKKQDPFINPTKDYFVNQCFEIMKIKPRLSFTECNRLLEIAADNEDYKEIMPLALEKLKTIKWEFKDGVKKPSINWMLEGNNFEKILNGHFDKTLTDDELFMQKLNKEREDKKKNENG